MYDTLEAMAHSIIALNPSLSGKGRLWQAILGVRASSTFAQWIVALQSHVTCRIHETSTALLRQKTQKGLVDSSNVGPFVQKVQLNTKDSKGFPVSSSKILTTLFFFHARERSGILTEFRCSEVGITLGIRVAQLMRVALVKLMNSSARTWQMWL